MYFLPDLQLYIECHGIMLQKWNVYPYKTEYYE